MTMSFRQQSGWFHASRKILVSSYDVTVPQTDTGRQVEDTKALERTLVKELGKIAP
jgi:hypothetical protein